MLAFSNWLSRFFFFVEAVAFQLHELRNGIDIVEVVAGFLGAQTASKGLGPHFTSISGTRVKRMGPA
jgi:hypothetical protein